MAIDTIHYGVGDMVNIGNVNLKLALGSLLLLVPIVNYAVMAIRTELTLRSSKDGREPPLLPYFIPFLGSLVEAMRDSTKFMKKITNLYGEDVPVGVRIGPLQAYLLATPELFTKLTKASLQLTPKPAIALAMANIFGTPAKAIHIYWDDKSGISPIPLAGTNVAPENRIWHLQSTAAHKNLSGNSLKAMGKRFMEFLAEDIAADSSIGDDWVQLPDLYGFWQSQVVRAAIKSLFGSHILRLNPTFVDDFWTYVAQMSTLMMGLPRWVTPTAYADRDRVLTALMRWHEYAKAHSDFTKTGPDDVEWDEYWGSKYLKIRYQFRNNISCMDAEAHAADDLALMVAANANAIISAIWFLIETLREPSVHAEISDEIEAARLPTSTSADSTVRFDATTLCAQPLLQSIYAETLRLRVALLINRTGQLSDVRLGPWRFPRNSPIAVSTLAAAQNPRVWNDADGKHPVDTFWAHRFVIDPSDPRSGPLALEARHRLEEEKAKYQDETLENPKKRFSVEGLQGGWIPYGAGQFMCPGRHLAKQEMIGSFAMFYSSYEVQLCTPDDWKPQPDLTYFATGTMPPLGQIPFRVRRRSGRRSGK